jgi:putative SOS response-associated peptidase YedK
MSHRYTIRQAGNLARYFNAIDRRGTHYDLRFAQLPVRSPRYNVEHGQPVPIVRAVESRRELVTAKWGLVPHWSKYPFRGSPVTAHGETIWDNLVFKDAFQKRRCLIPSDGFIMLGKDDGRAYLFEFPDRRLFAFAGLWDNGRNIESCAIVNVAADKSAKPKLERMPLILRPDDYAVWLNPDTDEQTLKQLLQPTEEELIPIRMIRRSYKDVEGPECIEAVEMK